MDFALDARSLAKAAEKPGTACRIAVADKTVIR
jgi:hypothetical protein